MTNRPYTDDDLRAEAARLHAQFATEEDEGLVGERMEDHHVTSLGEAGEDSARTWAELLEPDGEGTPEYVAAQRAVCALLKDAADVSEWAINLGADGLEPLPEQLSAQTDNGPWFRLHFAVRPDMPDDMRRALVEGIGAEIAKHF